MRRRPRRTAGRAGVGRTPERRRSPSERAKSRDRSERPMRCTSRPAGRGEQRHQQPDRAGPEHQHPLAGVQVGRPDRAQGVAPRLDEGARGGVDAVGQGCSEVTGTASCSARAPAKPPRMPTSNRSAHTCWWPPRQRRHRPQPSMVSPVTRRPTQSRSPRRRPTATVPHHSWPRRSGKLRVALVQVGHLAGEELDVRAADADPLDVDDHLTRPRPRSGRRPGRRPHRGRGDDEGPHAVTGGPRTVWR